MKSCANCEREFRRLAGRGLCKACYSWHAREGTLEQFDLVKSGPGDLAYRKWLVSDPKVSCDVLRPWVEYLVGLHGDVATAARHARVDDGTLRRIRSGQWERVRYSVAEEIAVAAGRMVELAMAMPEVGVEGWSEYGRYCGDNSPLHHGCGSGFHPHASEGLCRECHAIATGALEMETRDIRFTREAARA